MAVKEKSPTKFDQLAQENSRLRGDLLTIGSRVNHDLRTPLGGIVNTGELLREILARDDPSTAALTDSLFTSVDEMVRLIKNISIITRASARPVTKLLVQMDQIVTAVTQRLESRVLKRGATVTSQDSWPAVKGVSDWLEWVWWNFLVNALQHGGEKIELGWEPDGNGFKFWISDNGPGVPAELVPALFRPFDTLHEPGSPRGIGLSVVERLVKLQGGRCGYERLVEKSNFYFTLPASAVGHSSEN